MTTQMDCPCCVAVRKVFNLPLVDAVGPVCAVCTQYDIPVFLLTNPTKEQFREYVEQKNIG